MLLPSIKSAPEPTPKPDLPKARGHLRTWIVAVILALGTMALYWPATRHDFVDYDDPRYVTENIHVQQGLTLHNVSWALHTPISGNWHPLTMLSHMLDCQLYGLSPGGHHLTSIILHMANSVLLFLLLRQLTGTFWRSAFVAALFAWHPLHVESVAWVAERKDVLSACFGLLSLLCYSVFARRLKKNDPGTDVKTEPISPAFFQSGFYWLALFCFALGLMSKSMLVTWPCVMVLLDFWPLERFQRFRAGQLIIEKIPFFALALAGSIITFLAQSDAGATHSMEVHSFGLRFGNSVLSYSRYLLDIIWPRDLAVFYPYPTHLPVGITLLAALLLCAVTAILWINRRIQSPLFVGWLWFLGTLVPVIGLVEVGKQAMADRYSYLPSVGALITIVWGLYELSRRWRCQTFFAAFGAAVIALYAASTSQQLSYWQNSETLFRHALKVTTDNDVARNNLGVALLDSGQTNAAMAEFQAAVQLSPDAFEAHENIGNILANRGDIDAAMREYRETIRLKPNQAEAHNNLGILLTTKGQTDEALTEYQEAIRLNPEFAEARYNFGKLLAQRGYVDDAILQYQAALEVTPADAELHFRVGNLLAKKGRTDEAIDQFEQAVELKPDFAEAHSNLGNLLSGKGQPDEAIAQFQAAIRLKPDFRDAHYNLANALFKSGRLGGAADEYQAVIKLSPDFAAAHYYLGLCFLRSDRLDNAISQFQETLRLRPDFVEATTNLSRALELKNHPH